MGQNWLNVSVGPAGRESLLQYHPPEASVPELLVRVFLAPAVGLSLTKLAFQHVACLVDRVVRAVPLAGGDVQPAVGVQANPSEEQRRAAEFLVVFVEVNLRVEDGHV